MLDGGKAGDGLSGHPLGGGVGGEEVGVALLEGDELAVEPVVLLVGDLRRILDVVEVVVLADRRPQRLRPLRGVLASLLFLSGHRSLSGRGGEL